MKIIDRGVTGETHKYAIIEAWFNGDKRSFDEIIDLFETWDDEPARMTIIIDPHHIQKPDNFIDQLNIIDDHAREKGVEVRIEFMCLCDDCRRISADAIISTVRWRSRWGGT